MAKRLGKVLLTTLAMLLGLLVLVIGAVSLLDRVDLVQRGTTATGTVLSIRTNNQRSVKTDYATVRYEPAGGAAVEFTAGSPLMGKYQPGDPIAVIYDGEKPERAEINTVWVIWWHPALMLVLAVLFLAGGPLLLR